jgi:hypothetical protein
MPLMKALDNERQENFERRAAESEEGLPVSSWVTLLEFQSYTGVIRAAESEEGLPVSSWVTLLEFQSYTGVIPGSHWCNPRVTVV